MTSEIPNLGMIEHLIDEYTDKLETLEKEIMVKQEIFKAYLEVRQQLKQVKDIMVGGYDGETN
jgi:hypothetical protein